MFPAEKEWGPTLANPSWQVLRSGANTTYLVADGATHRYLRLYRPGRRTEADADRQWGACHGYCELRPLPDADRAAIPWLAAARQIWFLGQLAVLTLAVQQAASPGP